MRYKYRHDYFISVMTKALDKNSDIIQICQLVYSNNQLAKILNLVATVQVMKT